MNHEHQPHSAVSPEPDPAPVARAGEPRPADETSAPDFRRLEVTANRFGPRIEEGIQQARKSRSEISPETARCIAHVLGRAYGRESVLADYGRTGQGRYLSLRDQYLDLYNAEQTHPVIKEWIDWLGTYLVRSEGITSPHSYMNEYLPPKLDRILVRTSVRIGDERYTVNVPADWDSSKEDNLIELLALLQLPEDNGLQAFLSLPDVNAGTDDLMESFHENFVNSYLFLEDAVRDLAEVNSLEFAIEEATESRALPEGTVQIDYNLIEEHVRNAYDLVNWKGRIYVFQK